ncbi:uncharacterized protein [Halyomorpha halys]|uniref:uncharacterized protein isoform X2 n=1 Tax=Halyomorpha halys TaxID=286706 RepID=UPI0006D50DC5|nr:uncharacterized protein LOC106682172 [Halyomorpha halys]
MYFILGFGLLSVILAVGASEFDDELYISHKDKTVSTNDQHKQQKKNKLQTGHDSLELSFPLFPEWDDFPINNIEGKVKDSTKTFVDEKDPFSDITDTGKIFKSKKKPKDKFIMTFTEFFIPIMNHKNFDFPSMPRKLDFFEDFFKDFPLKDFEDQPIMRHKAPKRFLDFNPFLSFVRNTSSRISNLFNNNNFTISNATKKMEAKKFESLFQKPMNEAIVLMENKINGTDIIPVCCAGHTACRPNMHCEQGMCTDQHDKENVYLSRLKQMANVTKLSRIMIFYTIPILLGIGGIVVATEIIRKHNNAVKQVQFMKQYDPIQHC